MGPSSTQDQSRYQELFLASRDGIVSMDMQGNVLECNSAFEKMVGYSLQELKRKTFQDLTPARWHAMEGQILAEQALVRGYADPYEKELVHKNGTLVDVELTLCLRRDEAGQPAGLWACSRDITARKELEVRIQAQAQARTAEVAIFKALADNALNAIFLTDPDGHFSYANPATYAMFGYEPGTEEIIGRHGAEHWLEEDLPFLMGTILPQAAAGGWAGEIRQKRRDGALLDVSALIFSLRAEDGTPLAAASILSDITERKLAEARLREQEAFLRLVIDMNPSYIFVKDRDSRFILANKALVDLYGTTPEEIIGKTDADFADPEQAARLHLDDLEVMDSGREKVIADRPVQTADGQMHWLAATKRPMIDADGVARRLVGFSMDVTERKQAEAERQRLQQEVIEAQRRAIQELSTPIIPILETDLGGVIIMPLIGSIDTMRAKDITRSLLTGISHHRAKVVILDVTGVPLVDSGVANHLNKTIQAARLKGARTIVTGISEAVAEIIVDLGIDWSGIETLADLQTGLVAALGSLGVRLVEN